MLANSTTELYPNMCPILDYLEKVSIMKTLPKRERERVDLRMLTFKSCGLEFL